MKFLFFILLAFPTFSEANPFRIEWEKNNCTTEEDFLKVQEKLQKIDITPYLDDFYPKPPPRNWLKPWSFTITTKEDFKNRISKSLYRTLVKKGKKYPIKKLEKINKGGDNCIVCYVSLDGVYPDLIESLPRELESVGFNGYLLYMIGGFPNPTGQEIAYCGVPYAFKIFSLLEAEKLGFSKVLWVDSAFTPLKDPSPLFQWIEEKGSFLKMHKGFSKYILPKTREYLASVTGTDVLASPFVSAQVIGFDLSKPHCKEFIKKYYEMVSLGLPFFSCFPEEYVFTAIVGQNLEKWPSQPYKKVACLEKRAKGKSPTWAKEEGYFFLQKAH